MPSSRGDNSGTAASGGTAGGLDELEGDVVGIEEVDRLRAPVPSVRDLDRRRLEADALGAELGVGLVQVLDHERHVGVARVARAGIAAGAAGRLVLEQLDVMA